MIKKILFQYHIYEREYMILDLLSAELEKNGYETLIASMYDMKRCLLFNPDIIITHTIRDAELTACLSVIKLLTNAIVIPMTVEGYYDATDTEVVKTQVGINEMPNDLIDYFLMWGNKNKEIEGEELLRQKKIHSLEQIHVSGYVLYEKERVLEYAKHNEIAEHFEIWRKKYKKIITVLTGFIDAETSVEEALEMSAFNSLKGTLQFEEDIKNYKEKIILSNKYREKYIDTIIKLASCYRDVGFVVKLHPVEMEYYKNGRCRIYDKLKGFTNIFIVFSPISIGVFLDKSQLLIHYGSTVSLEAYIYGIPSLLLFDGSYDSKCSNFTKAIDLADFEEISKYVMGELSFENDVKTESVLFDSFNWEKNRPYTPVNLVVEFIKRISSKANSLDYNNVRSVISKYDFVRYRAKAFIAYLQIVKLSKEDAKRIKKQIVENVKGGNIVFLEDILTVVLYKTGIINAN